MMNLTFCPKYSHLKHSMSDASEALQKPTGTKKSESIFMKF